MTEIIAFDKKELFDKMNEEEITSLYRIANAGKKALSNNSSLAILVNSTAELAFYQKGEIGEIKTAKVKYCLNTQKPYIDTEYGKQYFDTFIRNNWGKVKIS